MVKELMILPISVKKVPLSVNVSHKIKGKKKEQFQSNIGYTIALLLYYTLSPLN